MRTKLVLVFLASIFLFASSLSRPVEAAGPVLRVSPVNTTAEPDATFTFDVRVTGVTQEKSLFGWAVTFKFDPKVINAVNATEGSFLKNVYETFPLTPSVDNAAGSIYFGATFKLPFPTSGAVGDGTLATFTFKAISRGSTSLHFEFSEETEYTRLYTVMSGNLVEIEHTREDGSFSNGSSGGLSGLSLPFELIAVIVVIVAVGGAGAFFMWRRRRSQE